MKRLFFALSLVWMLSSAMSCETCYECTFTVTVNSGDSTQTVNSAPEEVCTRSEMEDLEERGYVCAAKP